MKSGKRLLMMLMAFGCGVLSATVAVAAENDALMTFSTRGPDRYADGSPVGAGEVYALVWVRSGHAFAGVDLNGAPVDPANSAVLVAQPLAKVKSVRGETVGFCPPTLFQVPAAFADGHTDGSYALCLFDTRTPTGNGLAPAGTGGAVQGWGLVENARIRCASGGAATALRSGADAGTVAAAKTAIPAGEKIPTPRITAIKVADGFVTLTVEGTSPRLLYNVASGGVPGRRTRTHAAHAPKSGRNRPDEELTFVVPVRAGENFFRIVRN